MSRTDVQAAELASPATIAAWCALEIVLLMRSRAVATSGKRSLNMKKNHQYRTVIHQLSAHFRQGLLVLVLAAPSAFAAPSPAPDRFAQADANHDGKLSRDEASDYLVIEIFNSRDANHDGRMTVAEWIGSDPTRTAEFKQRDANNDGIVTMQEAITYGRAHGIANEIMKEADKNYDRCLSRVELKAYYASREGPAR